MASMFKLARQSSEERRSMPLEVLIRGMYRAAIRKQQIERLSPTESVTKVASRSVAGYVGELTRRLMSIWGEENHRSVASSQQWQLRVDAKLNAGPPLEHRD